MKSVDIAIPSGSLPGADLYRAFVAGTNPMLDGLLGGYSASSAAWRRATEVPRAIDPRVIDRVVETNARWGVADATLAKLRGATNGSTRFVVTGQQPGLVGGSLLSLYKAATAIALADEVESRWGVACVAAFWLGADDDDFAEIREIDIVASDVSLVSARLDASAHAPGRRVGDIAAAHVARTWDAVSAFLPKNPIVEAIGRTVHQEGDLASIATKVLVALTAGRMVIIDGRDGVLRDASRDLLLSFFDREADVRTAVTKSGDALEGAGFHAQLDVGADSGLFLVRDGVRQRVPADARSAARAEFVRDIGAVSPGVVARNLMQDAVFAPIAVVLGPAEIAYRAQLVAVYEMFGIARPVVFPRLAATFVPPAVRDATIERSVDAVLLVRDPAAWVSAVVESARDANLADAARSFESSFAAASSRFVAAAGARLDPRAKEKLDRRVADIAGRVASVTAGAIEQDALASVAQWPWLARAAELFVRDGVVQERYLSLTVPAAFHGEDAVSLVERVAATHVRDVLDGRVLHRVYSR